MLSWHCAICSAMRPCAELLQTQSTERTSREHLCGVGTLASSLRRGCTTTVGISSISPSGCPLRPATTRLSVSACSGPGAKLRGRKRATPAAPSSEACSGWTSVDSACFNDAQVGDERQLRVPPIRMKPSNQQLLPHKQLLVLSFRSPLGCLQGICKRAGVPAQGRHLRSRPCCAHNMAMTGQGGVDSLERAYQTAAS